MKLAVIPARGGSVRIPRKNVRDFCGKPMIAWTIATARASGCFDRVTVSTDDEEIARVAREHGAEVPFMRPAHLADDRTGTRAVLRHAAAWWADRGNDLEVVACLYPTAPLLEPEDVRRGLALLASTAAGRVTAVVAYAHPIQRALRITEEGRLAMIDEGHATTRSQDLEPTYHDAGQLYLWRAAALLDAEGAAPPPHPLVLPRERAQDVDTFEDWAVAEALFLHARRADRGDS